jgi:hypothetical protein
VISFTRRQQIASEYLAGGRFEPSEAICRELWDEGHRTPELAALLGQLLALRNRPEEALPLLDQALAEGGEHPRIKALKADCQTRRKRFAEAAPIYRDLRRNGFAAKLEALVDGGAYRFASDALVDLPWAPGTRLPLVPCEINGAASLFMLDTGVGETLIDSDLAERAGISSLGPEPIQLPAGPAGVIEHAIIPSITLGNCRIDAVPAQIFPVRDTFASLLGLPVDGIFGVGLFSQQPTTLDYRARSLRIGPAEPRAVGSSFFWAAGQYPLVPVKLNERLETLLFLDTGMIGAAVGLPLSIARAAEVQVAVGASGVGFAVDRSLQAQPILCPSVAAMGVRRDNLPGMLLGQFRLERQLGFRIGGLLGDGFVNMGRLHMDFRAMAIALSLEPC